MITLLNLVTAIRSTPDEHLSELLAEFGNSPVLIEEQAILDELSLSEYPEHLDVTGTEPIQKNEWANLKDLEYFKLMAELEKLAHKDLFPFKVLRVDELDPETLELEIKGYRPTIFGLSDFDFEDDFKIVKDKLYELVLAASLNGGLPRMGIPDHTHGLCFYRGSAEESELMAQLKPSNKQVLLRFLESCDSRRSTICDIADGAFQGIGGPFSFILGKETSRLLLEGRDILRFNTRNLSGMVLRQTGIPGIKLRRQEDDYVLGKQKSEYTTALPLWQKSLLPPEYFKVEGSVDVYDERGNWTEQHKLRFKNGYKPKLVPLNVGGRSSPNRYTILSDEEGSVQFVPQGAPVVNLHSKECRFECVCRKLHRHYG